MRVLVCGDREGFDHDAIVTRLCAFPLGTMIVHGACRGVDNQAAFIAARLGLEDEPHPYIGSLGKAGGPIRNQQMLDSGIDLVIAFHSNLSKSKGTKDMLARARKANVPTEVIE